MYNILTHTHIFLEKKSQNVDIKWIYIVESLVAQLVKNLPTMWESWLPFKTITTIYYLLVI